MTLDEKLDDALKGTFPASDAFYLSPHNTASVANDQIRGARPPGKDLGRETVPSGR